MSTQREGMAGFASAMTRRVISAQLKATTGPIQWVGQPRTSAATSSSITPPNSHITRLNQTYARFADSPASDGWGAPLERCHQFQRCRGSGVPHVQGSSLFSCQPGGGVQSSGGSGSSIPSW